MNLSKMNKELPAGSTLLHYRIVSKIGAGGMGEVYLAQDTRLDRKVAIKFLHEEFSKDAEKLGRFIREAKAASALNHPNILTVYEIGEVDGKNYIATELIDGKTLREHLSRKETLQLNAILKIGVQVSEALSAAHQAGIIHRDIKPENIMLRKDGYAKVLDFGLAKMTEDVDMRYQSTRDLLIDLKNLRRELDIQGELERSVIPHRETANAPSENVAQVYVSDAVETTKSGQAAATQNVSTSSSSLEYAVTQAKTHKLATAIVALVLLGVISTVGYFAFASRGAGTKQISSIAVMPFVNESGNADVEYLSDGMTETLIKSLSNLSNLDVKPRSSVFRYKGKDTDLQMIAKELNVQAILNGRVAQRGDQLTLSLELVDVQKNSVMWTEQYERKQSDLVSLQSEIAKDVSTNLKAKLSGAEETKVTKTATADPEAYQAYLKGRYYWNRRTTENLKKAIEQFKSATDRDPNYALAFVGLADCYAVLNEYAGTP